MAWFRNFGLHPKLAPCWKRKWLCLLCTKKASIAVQYLKYFVQIIIYLTISCNIFVSSRNISILSIFHGSLISKRSWFVWFHHLLGRITVLSANYFSFHRKTQNFSYQMSKHSSFSSHNFPTTVTLRTCFLQGLPIFIVCRSELWRNLFETSYLCRWDSKWSSFRNSAVEAKSLSNKANDLLLDFRNFFIARVPYTFRGFVFVDTICRLSKKHVSVCALENESAQSHQVLTIHQINTVSQSLKMNSVV